MIRYLLILIAVLFCSTVQCAVSPDDIERLEAEMHYYFSSEDHDKFFSITEQLKDASKDAGDEEMYYSTWGYQSIYEATQQNYRQALEIVQKIHDDARENGSIYGEYAAMHAKATILFEKHDYDAAEEAFLNAVEFHHRHFPNESAAADLQELMKIANLRKDTKACARFARQIVKESNVDPIHKGKALSYLCQMAFDNNDIDEFNRLYEEMELLQGADSLSSLKTLVEINYHIINGDYHQALQLSNQLDEVNSAERKALIYHRMGDDTNAYNYMLLYKTLSDSITQASHSSAISTYFTQMNDNREELEQNMLERENTRLRIRFYMALGIAAFVVLFFFTLRARRLVQKLRQDNMFLTDERKDAERTLTDLNELSFFESKKELSLTSPVRLNDMCNRLAGATQSLCHKGVTIMFMTDFPDSFEMKSESDALKKLLTHLLHYSARFTHKGFIKLVCTDAGENILFSVMDTSSSLSKKPTKTIIGMSSEQNDKIRYVGMNFNICQSITRLLMGRIWYDAEYTNGTRFYCELPKDPNSLLNNLKNRGGDLEPSINE
ncbi:MAG: hypothetical protein J5486_01265 [Bacteroidaceae bacterium]|nr:hypothetical protein [Bacteroidaceae bacterium]